MPPRLHAVALALAGLNLSFAVAEETITVCSSGCDFTSINAAIDSAKDGDVIALSAEQYIEGETIDFKRKGVTLLGAVDENGDPTTILDGMNQYAVLHTSISSYQPPDDGAPPIRLENLIIQNGYSNGVGGGGLTVLRKNVSAITNCIFQSNSSIGKAGAAQIEDSSPEITDCIFRNNTSSQSPSGSGGGGARAGAIVFMGADSSLVRCEFTTNSGGSGGAVGATQYYYQTAFELDIVECTFTDNQAVQGGGIQVSGGGLDIVDCTFTGNVAAQGGAIWVSEGSAVLNRCSMTQNRASGGSATSPFGDTTAIAGYGAAIYVGEGDYYYQAPASAQLTSCKVWCNIFGQDVIGPGAWMEEDSCIRTATVFSCECLTCGTCEPDSDLDGVADDLDLCPDENDRLDTDQDGTPDCLDGCPYNQDKTDPGVCGCGPQPYVEGDLDCDGDYDAEDARLSMAEFGIIEAGACPADTNGDGAVDGQDLAAVLSNWGLPCDG